MPCSLDPLTGFFRDGSAYLNSDAGTHTVCAIMTKEFLEFSKAQGNDLSTPRKEFNAGINARGRMVFVRASMGRGPEGGLCSKVRLSTNIKTLEFVELNELKNIR